MEEPNCLDDDEIVAYNVQLAQERVLKIVQEVLGKSKAARAKLEEITKRVNAED